MKTKIILMLTICLSAIAVNAQSVKVPAEVQPFVEKDAKAIALESADLNGDGIKDYILVLERENPTKMDKYDYPKNQRPLLILVRGKDKKLSETKRNEYAVMCSSCGGIFGDPFSGVTVGTKTFTVKHYGGSAWRWTEDYTFNYSRIDKTWQLVKIEKTSYHNVRPMKETLEKTVLTPPKDFGKVDIADFDPSDYREKDVEDSASTENDSMGKIDFSEINRQIETAAKANESWVKMPIQIIAKMIGQFSEIKSRTIEMTAPTPDGADSITVIVTDDGFLDDSVRGERHTFELKMNEQGVWKVVSASKAWRCWEGRGHQDYSTELCI